MNEQEAIVLIKRTKPKGNSAIEIQLNAALDLAISALEKQIPKKQGGVNDYSSHLKLSESGFLCCNTTNKDIRYPLISLRDLDYCPRCGKKLDWRE